MMISQSKGAGVLNLANTSSPSNQFKGYRKSSFMDSVKGIQFEMVDEQSKHEEELDDFDDGASPSERRLHSNKLAKPITFKKSYNQSGAKNMDTDAYEENDKTHKTPRIFQQAKYVMKPLDQFLEEQQKEKMNNSIKMSLSLSQGLGKDKTISQKGGLHHIPLGFGKVNQPQSSISQSKLKQIFDQSPNKHKVTQSTKPDNFSSSVINTIPTLLKTESSVSTVEDKDISKIKSIFSDNIDLKQNNVTPLFDTGPRYDKNSNLLTYSIVGKAEWYKKIDQQKNGSKLTHMNMKSILQQSGRSTSGAKSIQQQNFDMKSILSKAKKSIKLLGEGGSERGGNKFQTVTKDHLLMKYSEIEQRVVHNKEKETQNLSSQRFQEQIDETRQERTLKHFETQRDTWMNTAQTLIQKQDPSQTLLGKGPLAQTSYRKYKNYQRQNFEDTLLMRSEDIYRNKKEQMEYLEHLKDPFEYIGQKNLWESMLRNDGIDITTKYSQKKQMDNYFFPKQLGDNQNGKEVHSSHTLEGDRSGNQVDLNLFRDAPRLQTADGTKSKFQSTVNIPESNKNQPQFFKNVSIKDAQQITEERLVSDRLIPQESGMHSRKSILKIATGMPRSTKIDLTFRKSDYSVRELSHTHGIRILTQLNHENLEMIRTPRMLFHDTQNSSQNNTFKCSIKDQSGFNSTRGLTRTFNTSNYFLEKEKEQTSKYGSIMKQPYLDYFTQSEIDNLAIFGDNKLSMEKNSLSNDGKQRFETYQLVNIAQEKQKKGIEQPIVTSQQLISSKKISRANSIHANNKKENVSFIRQSNMSRIQLQQKQNQQQSLSEIQGSIVKEQQPEENGIQSSKKGSKTLL